MQSIGSFAESLILGGGISNQDTAPVPSSNNPYIKGNDRDISDVQLSEDMRKSLVESVVAGDTPDVTIFGNEVEQEEVPEVDPSQELKDLIVELKGLVQEMTATGSGGAHFGGDTTKQAYDQFEKAELRRGYVRPLKPKSKGDVGTKFYKAANRVRSRIRGKKKK